MKTLVAMSRSPAVSCFMLSSARSSRNLEEHIPPGTRSVSVFLVNDRAPDDTLADLAYVFQPELRVGGGRPFVPRPDLRGTRADRWDDRVADLHYADTPSYATGHGVSADWEILDGDCRLLRTAWIPRAEVEKTATAEVPGVELAMEALGSLPDGTAAGQALRPLAEQYRAWVQARLQQVEDLEGTRGETAAELLRLAGHAAGRIERGIAVLAAEEDALDAFRVANRAVARALRQRLDIEEPRWRPFQLAFILLNLPGLIDPARQKPRDRGPAVLPHRRWQDRSVSRPCRLCHGAEKTAPSGGAAGGPAPG